MRFLTVLMLALMAGQSAPVANPSATDSPAAASSPASQTYTIAAGTRLPVTLKHAISTKSTREGDPVYAETTFPVVDNGHILIPAGTYVQGRIAHIQRAGHLKGRAEVLMHFTTLIYPNGYTVMLPGSVENAPGIDKTKVKDQEGTIQGDSQTGEKVGTVASSAGTGAVIGGLAKGGKGAAIGAGIGGAVGSAIALLSRGNDVKMDAGTTIEMVIERAVPLEAARLQTTAK